MAVYGHYRTKSQCHKCLTITVHSAYPIQAIILQFEELFYSSVEAEYENQNTITFERADSSSKRRIPACIPPLVSTKRSKSLIHRWHIMYRVFVSTTLAEYKMQ